MITANEMREFYNNARSIFTEAELNSVENLLKTSNKTSIRYYGHLYNETIKTLKRLGYKVKKPLFYLEPYYEISF